MPIEVRPEMTIAWPKEIYLNKKSICIDLDGVICEYNFPKIVKDFLGVKISPQSIFAYDLADVLGVSPGLIDIMFRGQVFGPPNFIFGALDTLKKWKIKGYDLYIYSNRIKYMGHDGLMRWLINWQIPFTHVDNGQGEYDAHIDDSPGKLMSTKSKLKLLFDQPWNRRCLNITGELKRVTNWNEILQMPSLR